MLLRVDSVSSDRSSMDSKTDKKKVEQSFNVRIVRETKICNFLEHKSHSTSKLHDKKLISAAGNFMGDLTPSLRDHR